ncbi:MAG TPA: sulfite exporter TauE/SafE family protein [Acidimicrobiales bacterium]|nr:sulfite exporter TauE/SafE family protein [Acidimicrobiales bacterium]
MTASELLFLAAAGFGAGVVNGVAGGGSMVSFPALLAVGVPSLAANVTSTVGIWPGYLGGVAGFRRALAAQRDRLRPLAAVALAGAVVGALALLVTSEDGFDALAPWLVLLACGLFAAQPLLARRLTAFGPTPRGHGALRYGGVFAGAVYGAYFGAGLGVLLLAVLGITLPGRLVDLNGIRSVLALLVNSIAVVVFAVAAPVEWAAAGTMAAASLVGGYVGATASTRLPVPVFRVVVLALGLAAFVGLLAT